MATNYNAPDRDGTLDPYNPNNQYYDSSSDEESSAHDDSSNELGSIEDDEDYQRDFRDDPNDNSSTARRRRRGSGDEEEDYSDEDDDDGDGDSKERGDGEEPRRQFKYSTANMKTRSKWWRWCWIFLLFMLFFAFSIAISLLFNKLFFKNNPPPTPPEYDERSPNETAFPHDKAMIDQACSFGRIDLDRGAQCEMMCEPQFFKCCDPFDEFKVYNLSEVVPNTTTSGNSTEEEEEEDMGLLQVDIENCTFGSELRGCMAYSKCQAITQLMDPAPGTLPILCGQERMEADPVSCSESCKKLECCFHEDDGLSCLGANLDICMDYSPCQNLREKDNKVWTAPDDLDRACLWELPECFEYCEQAACCADSNSRCFQENFLACLTYAPCTEANITTVNITVPDMFARVAQPPIELLYACNELEDPAITDIPYSCEQYCEQAACCYETDPEENCFHDDPLGCWAWHQECQNVPSFRQAWFTETIHGYNEAQPPPPLEEEGQPSAQQDNGGDSQISQ